MTFYGSNQISLLEKTYFEVKTLIESLGDHFDPLIHTTLQDENLHVFRFRSQNLQNGVQSKMEGHQLVASIDPNTLFLGWFSEIVIILWDIRPEEIIIVQKT